MRAKGDINRNIIIGRAMEEKRKSSSKISQESGRNSVRGSNRSIEGRSSSRKITTKMAKQPLPHDMSRYSKSRDSKTRPNNHDQDHDDSNKENSKVHQPFHSRPLRRIGKQKLVSAYVEQISYEPAKPLQAIDGLTLAEPTIVKIVDQQNTPKGIQGHTPECPSDQVEQPMLIGDGPETEEILFAKTSSIKQEHNRFSINVKRIDAESTKRQEKEKEECSAFQRSDECIESIVKTDSDHGASNSDIVDGQLNHLINQSFANTDNQLDSKIEELLDEIQKNYSKNYQKIQQKEAKSKNRQSKNFLMVPKDQRLSYLKNGKKQKTKQIQKQHTSEIVQSTKPEGQQKPKQNSTQRSQTKKLDSAGLLTGKKQKLWNLPVKKSFQTWLQERNLTQKSTQEKKTDKIALNNIIDSKIRDLPTAAEVQKQRKKPKPISPERTRLFASEGPRKTIKGEPIQKTNDSDHKSPTNQVITKLTDSQVCLQSLKVKQQGPNSKSLHQKKPQKDRVLKKESIAIRFKPTIPKIDEPSHCQDMKGSVPIGKRNRQLQVNKCVGEARKLVSKIGN